MVYVLDMNGQPLMPTFRHGKVRHLLKENKAKVIKRCPFTIQLLYKSTTYTQPITLEVDAGSKHVGLVKGYIYSTRNRSIFNIWIYHKEYEN